MSKRKQQEAKYIIVTGNPADGFTYYGPFKNFARAHEWAVNYRLLAERNWWAIPLTKGEQHEQGGK
jgi:hypothetical protein